jgi:hypothetical protein
MPRPACAIPTAGAVGAAAAGLHPAFGPGSAAPGGVHYGDGPVYLLGVPAEEPAQVFHQGGSAQRPGEELLNEAHECRASWSCGYVASIPRAR